MLKHGSLFSGIGGFELAAEWAGWTNVFHCEWNEFGKQVLQYYWPYSESFHDIKQSDFKKYEGRIDIITGGFPCQPFSAAGKRKGADDDRYLWPEMLRVIDEVKPSWVVGENVAGLISMVQPGDEVTVESGRTLFDEDYTETVLRNEYVIETVCKDLERIGYTVQPVVIPACAAGAPHRRDRIWFIAHSDSRGHRINGCKKGITDKIQGEHREEICTGLFDGASYGVAPDTISSGYGGRTETTGNNKSGGIRELVQDCGRNGDEVRCETERCGEVTTDTRNLRLQGGELNGSIRSTGETETKGRQFSRSIPPNWSEFPTQSPVCRGTNGISTILVRNIKPEIYGQISERYTDKDLQEVWETFQSEEIREQIGGLYKISEPGILFQVLQLCSPSCTEQKGTSVWSEKTSEKLLRKLREYGKFADTPQGRELEKQFRIQFGDSLPDLSHEVALVAMEVERVAKSHVSWHRIESIKAYGNAIVPQVAYEIFKAINEVELNKTPF